VSTNFTPGEQIKELPSSQNYSGLVQLGRAWPIRHSSGLDAAADTGFSAAGGHDRTKVTDRRETSETGYGVILVETKRADRRGLNVKKGAIFAEFGPDVGG